MFDPPGSDNNQEYIEVITNESLINWTIADSDANDTLQLLKLGNSSFALIVEDGFDTRISDATYYTVGSTIGNNLNNAEDSIYLFHNNTLIDSMSYNGTGPAVELCDDWVASDGTPGRVNSCPVPVVENETYVNVTFDSTCDIEPWITSDKQIYSEGEQVKYRIGTNATDFTIEYWIEALANNIIKKRYNSTNANQRAWTPSCSKGTAFVIKARVFAECGISDDASHLIGVQCPVVSEDEEEEEYDEELKILDNDEEAKFGDITNVKLHLAKGDTSKSVVEVYIEGDSRVSEKSKVYLNSKNSEVDVIIPLAIIPDCDEKLEGEYEIIAKGLGLEDSVDIELSGNKAGVCQVETIIEECEVVECETVEPKIKSFYTRAKKYAEQIRLYASVDCPENCTVVLSGDNGVLEKRSIINYSGKIDFNTTWSKDYHLELLTGARQEMELDFEIPKVKNETKPKRPVVNKTQSITGKTVYESKSTKSRGFVKYLLGAVGLLGGIIIFRKTW